MTNSQSFDEIEYVAPLGEPSHVHIPRPSRLKSGLIAVDGDLERREAATRCACCED
jgi:hypothetical protein